MEKEYRGQKVIATYTARMLPPDNNYPDCVCQIVLTEQHLYVLEDNFDGTYETHFEFVVREIDDIGIERWNKEKSSDSQAASASKQLITAAVYVAAGVIPIPTGSRKKVIKKEYFVIKYHDVQGVMQKLYFHMNDAGAKKFIKTFHKIRAAQI